MAKRDSTVLTFGAALVAKRAGRALDVMRAMLAEKRGSGLMKLYPSVTRRFLWWTWTSTGSPTFREQMDHDFEVGRIEDAVFRLEALVALSRDTKCGNIMLSVEDAKLCALGIEP